jgi:redox-sensitive bicupin YhaK (pirin superfamily)
VIHSEMPQQESGRMRGFQLWVNLPAEQKMTAPEYQEVRPEAIPEIGNGGSNVRVVAGGFDGERGPVSDPNTGIQFLDVSLSAGEAFSHTLLREQTAFLYVFEGAVVVADEPLREQQLAVLDNGEQVVVTADESGARFLLVAGSAIGEPIVQYGPFVMNTREEIEQALDDYRDGKLVQRKAAMINR